jgi:hypothetical protein
MGYTDMTSAATPQVDSKNVPLFARVFFDMAMREAIRNYSCECESCVIKATNFVVENIVGQWTNSGYYGYYDEDEGE